MIRKYTQQEYRTFGYLNGVAKDDYRYFDSVRSDEADPPHHVKLDTLAQMALEASKSDDDWMIFMDGDAFPVSPVVDKLSEYLKTNELAAIQRNENEGEQHAHPAFCVTTTGFWRKYRPSWAPGFTWRTPEGREMTDVGGELLGVLHTQGIAWKRLLRSNRHNLHPVLFGIYDDLVYHHGTGFRAGAIVRYDYLSKVEPIRRLDGRILLQLVPRKWRSRVRTSILHPQGRMQRRLAHRYRRLSEQVYAALSSDSDAFIATLR